MNHVKTLARIIKTHWLNISGALLILIGFRLGDWCGFYDRFWWWDVWQHALFGVLAANTLSKTKATRPLLITALIAISWEVFEWFMTTYHGVRMVKGGAWDTASDLMLCGLGYVTYATIKKLSKKQNENSK